MHARTRSFSALRSRLTVLAALALALAVVGAASASVASTHYKGKTKQGLSVTFRTTATSVVGFKATVRTLCLSASTGKSVLEFYPVLLQSPTRLANGKFKISFKGKSSTFITVTGKISGSASGSLDVRYTKTLGMTTTGLLDIGACSAKTTWTARTS